MDDDDKHLVDLARAGDPGAFDTLVTRHRRRVLGLLHQMVRQVDDATDLAQETFVRAWRGLGGFDGRHPFTTWLHRIATNAAIDFLRSRARRPIAVEFDEAAVPSSETGSSFDEAHIRFRIDAALATLSPDHRAVLVLREIEGHSYEEIADILGCSQGTVMSRLFHARRKMQAQLKDLHEGL